MPADRRRCGTAGRRRADRASPDDRRRARSRLNACISRLRWVSTAPLGRPVVPDVYMMNAASSLVDVDGQVGSARPRPARPRTLGAGRRRRPRRPGRRPTSRAPRAAGAAPASGASTTHGDGAAVGEHVADLVGDETEVDRARRSRPPWASEEDLDHLQPVEGSTATRSPAPTPRCGQRLGQPVRPARPTRRRCGRRPRIAGPRASGVRRACRASWSLRVMPRPSSRGIGTVKAGPSGRGM